MDPALSGGDGRAEGEPPAEAKSNYDVQDFPVNLIVTHIAGTGENASGRRARRRSGKGAPTTAAEDIPEERSLLDSWSVQLNQVCRWSELRNDRNVEIDGVSRLKVYKDGFAFESSVREQLRRQTH